MIKYIFIGIYLISWTATAARLESQYIPPNGNSIGSCGPSVGQKDQYQAPYSPQPQGQQIPILKYEHNDNGDGSYNFA